MGPWVKPAVTPLIAVLRHVVALNTAVSYALLYFVTPANSAFLLSAATEKQQKTANSNNPFFDAMMPELLVLKC